MKRTTLYQLNLHLSYILSHFVGTMFFVDFISTTNLNIHFIARKINNFSVPVHYALIWLLFSSGISPFTLFSNRNSQKTSSLLAAPAPCWHWRILVNQKENVIKRTLTSVMKKKQTMMMVVVVMMADTIVSELKVAKIV